MKLRLSIVDMMFGNKGLSNAVAFSLYVKSRTVSSSVPNCSINKLRSITGMSAEAIKKRLNTLLYYGLAEYQGKDNRCLVFKKLKSDSRLKNLCLPSIPSLFNKVKDAEKYIKVTLFMAIQQRKDYVRRFAFTDDVRSVKELKRRRKSGALSVRSEYRELGLSYKGIAKKLGVSLKTAFETVKIAIKNGLVIKIRHIHQVVCRGIGQFFVSFSDTGLYPNHFTTRNALYQCCANTYIIAYI